MKTCSKTEKRQRIATRGNIGLSDCQKGDTVFLYQSGVGIVAIGKASGILEKRPHGNPQSPEDEYAMPLKNFMLLDNPLPAAEVKEVTGVDYRFMGTMFALDAESGKILSAHVLHSRAKK